MPTYTWTQGDKDGLQTAYNTGGAAAAYAYVNDLMNWARLNSYDVDDGAQSWVQAASNINQDSGWLAAYTRTYVALGIVFNGQILTGTQVQAVSNQIALNYIERTVQQGSFLTTNETIDNDVNTMVDSLGIAPNNWPGVLAWDSMYGYDFDTLMNGPKDYFVAMSKAAIAALTATFDPFVGVAAGVAAWVQDELQKIADDYIDPPLNQAPTLPASPLIPVLPPEVDIPQVAKDPDSCPVPEDWFPPLNDGMGQAPLIWSPLVIDMDGDGIELTNLNGGAVYWDIDSDGFAEASAWVGPDDALLAIDLNEDGIINNHSELFGTQTVDGFTVLSAYDSNSDNVIDSDDDDFDKILVWRDLNQDGISQENELQTLTEAGIASINLNASHVNYSIEGNPVTHESTVTMADTSTRTIVDAWFNYDNANSIYVGEYELDERVLFLPALRGFGDVKSLSVQMSIDEDLLDRVVDVACASVEDMVDPGFDLIGRFKGILYRWAGVDGVEAPYFQTEDFTKKVEFLDTLTGRNAYIDGETAGHAQVAFIDRLWVQPFNKLLGNFLVQTELRVIFDGDGAYNPALGVTQGFTGLSEDGIEMVAGLIENSDDPLSGWASIVRLVEAIIGVNNLSSADFEMLDGLIGNSEIGLSLGDLSHVVKMNISDEINDAIVSDRFAIGTSGNDSLSKYETGLVLVGREGDDILNGSSGDDLHIGGSGNDTYYDFYGGNDVYVYENGNDLIYDTYSGDLGDKIVMDYGIDLADISIERINPADSESHLIWKHADMVINVAGRGQVTIGGHYDSYGNAGLNAIETLELADASVLSLLGLGDVQYGTSGADNIVGLDRSYYLNDIIDAGEGDDTINGGLGRNYLMGGYGNDTYVYGGGIDTILESGGAEDRILFDDSYDPELFSVVFNSNYNPYNADTHNIHVYYDDDLKVIIEKGLANGDGAFVEKVEIDGVDIIDIASLDYAQHGTEGNDTLYGFDSYIFQDNIIHGYGGDDSIFGRSGNDTIYGGDGNDYLYGDDGDDVLYGGDGNDYLSGGWGDDILYGGAGANDLEGGYGADTYVFEAAHAFADMDTVYGFSAGEGDKLDISDLLIGYVSGTSDINDFVSLSQNGYHMTLFVDRDGSGGSYSSQDIASFYYTSGLVVDDLLSNGNIIV